MATYVSLVHFTDQGIRQIKQTTERATALSVMASKLGVKIKDIYWTMGAYDAVFVSDAPNDEAVAALALNLGSLGNVRTQTMRAYPADEMKKILARLP